MKSKWAMICLLLTSSYLPAETKLDFLEAIRQIENSDNRLLSERSQIDAAKADSLSKKALFLPSIYLSAAKTQNKTTDTKYTSGEAVAKINLWSFGADYKAAQAASLGVDKGEIIFKKTKLNIQNEAFKTLLDFLVAKMQLDLEINILEIKKESLNVAQEKFNRGLVAQEDLLTTKVEVANAESTYHDLVIALENKRSLLVSLLGHDQVDMIWPINDKNLKTLEQRVLKREVNPLDRPDLKELAIHAKQQEDLSSSAFRRILPRLDLSLNRGFSQSESGSRYWETSGTLNLTIPLFDKFSDYAAYSYQRSMEMVAKNNYERAQKNIETELSTLQKNFIQTQKSYHDREETLNISRKLYKSNFARFKAGRSSFNDLAQDQSRYIQSEQLAIEGKKQLHEAFASLCFAQGQEIYQCF